MPAFSGVHGPGEMTIFSGARSAISSSVISSFRATRHVRAKLAEILVDVVGEAVVVVYQQYHRVLSFPPILYAPLSASSMARMTADALWIVSSYSDAGMLSKTMPPPAWAYATPSLTTSVRMVIAVSMLPEKSK